MIPISNPRFGRIHVLSRQVNEALAEAMTNKTNPSGFPKEVRIKILNGADAFTAVMGDDDSKKFLYYGLADGRGIIISNKDTQDMRDFQRKLKAEKSAGQKPDKSDFCNRFLTEKSVAQAIQWIFGRNDPDNRTP